MNIPVVLPFIHKQILMYIPWGCQNMFGLVTASLKELSKEQQLRYNGVYCGICRSIRDREGQLCRLGLSYDMAFLAILLMSLYEPEERSGSRACALHPFKPKPWVENDAVAYAADMNVALAYYKALDDWQDDAKRSAKWQAGIFGRRMDGIREQWPRQCEAIAGCIRRLAQLEKDGCANPDEPANAFGDLMSELFVWRQDNWEPYLRLMGHYLGRFIYLADAAVDYRADEKKNKYNPLRAMGRGEDWKLWEQYLVLSVAGCTDAYERLPLVQDKGILDNILYSGIWINYRQAQKAGRKEK